MDNSAGIKDSLSHIIKEFKDKRKNIEAVENYLLNDEKVTDTVRISITLQMQEFMPELFQWLYECVSLKRKTTKVFIFVMQFIPDLVHLYLICVSKNSQEKLKAPIEVLLLGISKELEAEKDIPVQVPSLTRPSIYHQSLSLVSPSRLTESALSHHDHDQTKNMPPHSPSFADKVITVTNRLPFLTHILRACINHVTQFNTESQTSFCLISTRITLSGMTNRCVAQVTKAITHRACLSEEETFALSDNKRINLDDDFLSCFLHGIRMCLFQSCHYPAKQALMAAKIRAEYNLFPQSLQISQTLERLVNEIHPLRLPLDTETHKTYSSKDANNWASKPSTIVRTFVGQVLYHNINPLSSHDNPHDVLDERISIDADELLISQSFEETLTSRQYKPPTDSPDGGLMLNIVEKYYSSEEDERSDGGGERLFETTPSKRDDKHDSDLSPSNITIVLQRSTPERTPERTLENEQMNNTNPSSITLSSTSSLKTTEV